jgi:putative transposase
VAHLKSRSFAANLILMPTPAAYKAPFYANQHYHLLFKSNDGILLFRNDEDRTCFLEKFSQFTRSIFNYQAYCMLDNHVHFIISVKENTLLQQSIAGINDGKKTVAMKKFLGDPVNELFTDELIERQINSFMVSYANSYNKTYKRNGGLFQSPFRRSTINEDAHLQQAIIYVHANAQKHGLIKDYRLYAYSSYNEILSGKSFVNVDDVINFFGGTKQFIDLHEQQVAYYYANNWPGSRIEVD